MEDELRELIKLKMRDYADAGSYVEEQNLNKIMEAVDSHIVAARIEELERIIAAYDMSGDLFFTHNNAHETVSLSGRINTLRQQYKTGEEK